MILETSASQVRNSMGGRLSAVFVGGGPLTVQCLDVWASAGHGTVAVVSENDATRAWAEQHDVLTVRSLGELSGALGDLRPDYLFSIVNLKIIPEDVLALPTRLGINFHDALLPRYAGLHATTWAIIGGEKTHGVTWHEMAIEVDRGRILKQHQFDISDNETAFSLNTKCYEAGIESFSSLVDELTDGRETYVQANDAERTYFSAAKRPEAACSLPWSKGSEQVDALVRALDFGQHRNPIGLPKVFLGPSDILCVKEVEALPIASTAFPGTITAVLRDGLQVATTTNDVIIRNLTEANGAAVDVSDLVQEGRLAVGQRLDEPSTSDAERLTKLYGRLARNESFWVDRLASYVPLEFPFSSPQPSKDTRTIVGAPKPLEQDAVIAVQNATGAATVADAATSAFAAYLARATDRSHVSFWLRDDTNAADSAEFGGVFACHLPVHVEWAKEASIQDAVKAVSTELRELKRRESFAHDLPSRSPEIRNRYASSLDISVRIVSDIDRYTTSRKADLEVLIAADGSAMRWAHNSATFSDENIAAMHAQFLVFCQAAAKGDGMLIDAPILPDAEHKRVIVDWNNTEVDYPTDVCIQQLFEQQVDRTPDAVAVVFEGSHMTFAELDRKSNQLARHLLNLGVASESLVGICLDRSLDLHVAILGVMKAGGAYVPLDPTYPRERLEFMASDSGLKVLLTQNEFAGLISTDGMEIVELDTDWPAIAMQDDTRLPAAGESSSLAYVIYTSGSTGKPKGVMLTHRNVVNFFAGMDARLRHDQPGTWLAVTSLSFDISVLELLWTLTRGFKVVLHEHSRKIQTRTITQTARRKLDFSLSYFSSDDAETNKNKYRLLLEGAKFADEHGFAAVWTPERHFHAFGGLFPNPSVISAALAMTTKNVSIRAGSCVLPLHSPVRVAEEWSVVDNLSNGRVGISFASGWQPVDFVLKPDSYRTAKDAMIRDIDKVRRLWRGESIKMTGVDGEEVDIRVRPRAIQPELPFWVTSAGSPDTFRIAGELGANLLTHLLGQSVDDLSQKIQLYRDAWKAAGHEGEGHVTLMMHTFVGKDDDSVYETVKEPMLAYLRSSVGLIRGYASSFPAFQKRLADGGTVDASFDNLTDDDMNALLEHAFHRYLRSGSLMGSVDTCIARLEEVAEIGVDELACLVDFGIDTDQVLTSLADLDVLRREWNTAPATDDFSLPGLIRTHRVTHMQCTPSLAGIYIQDPEAREALRNLDQLLLGGEALPVQLARDVLNLNGPQVVNMYGPTETTIWSTTHVIDRVEGAVPIGTPIANTQIFILDGSLRPVPQGAIGEIYIGGDGVARGYLGRPELTAERFVPSPFASDPSVRIYKTGDLGRYRDSGIIEFLGRTDFQVKIRGHRIELGEIESLLAARPDVKESVVVPREFGSGDTRLIAYVVPAGRDNIALEDLRQHCRSSLPDHMVPSQFVFMRELPRTPNGKTDRQALTSNQEVITEDVFQEAISGTERTVGEIWREILNVSRISVTTNFFDLGGHSLLAVQLHRRLAERVSARLQLTDIFRFPTIRSLSQYVEGVASGEWNKPAEQALDFGRRRRERLFARNGNS